jgi:hypothetical protein
MQLLPTDGVMQSGSISLAKLLRPESCRLRVQEKTSTLRTASRPENYFPCLKAPLVIICIA